MRSRALVLVVSVAFAGAAEAVTLLPLDAEDAVLLSTGKLELTAGAEYLEDVQPLFRRVERDQWSAPRLGVNAGLGTRAEVQARWEAIYLDEEDEDPLTGVRHSSYEAGDARVFTKIRVFSRGEYGNDWIPATALLLGVKFPNASFASGAGTDETDLFGHLLLAHDVGGVHLVVNAGFGILGRPRDLGGQNDVFLYDVAILSPPLAYRPLRLFGEVAGNEDDDRYEARGGLRIGGERLSAYFGTSAGLDPHSEDLGIRFGLVYGLTAFSD